MNFKYFSFNFYFVESFSRKDNTQLQQAAEEVEELLTGLIKEIEGQKQSKQ